MGCQCGHSSCTSVERAEAFFPVQNYDLGETLRSGQAFRWREIDGWWHGVVAGRWARLGQREDGIAAEAMSREISGDWRWLRDYLQVETDLAAVIRTFPRDEHMTAAVLQCPGLRLLKQEPWECLASFILSSTKQIVQIQQIVQLVCERFGERVPAPGSDAYAFPGPARIAALSEADLRCCKMGFRAPYLRGTAQLVASGELDLASLSQLSIEAARARLMQCPGVGRKVADCVLLFAYHFQQAFPVDVWILKALRKLYFPKRHPSPKRLLNFTQTYFGPNAGYAQQYLFHYMRTRIGREKNEQR
jgi:N-glycosylase/DNA lyase